MQAISFPEAPKVGGLETKLLVSPELFFPHRNNGNGLVVLSLDFFALESHAMPTKKFQNGTT